MENAYTISHPDIKVDPSDSSLVAGYDMVQDTAGIIPDKSGNGNDGTIVGNPIATQGMMGNGFQFDGVDDYVVIPDSDALHFGADNFTISLRVCQNVAGGAQHIYDQRDGATDGIVIRFNPSGDVQVDLNTESTPFLSSAVLLSGQQHFISVERDGNTFTLYVDGEIEDTNTSTGSIDTTVDAVIGTRSFTSPLNYLNGTVWSLQINDSAKGIGWQQKQYNLAKRALFKSEQVENTGIVSGGYIGRSPFIANSGAFQVVDDVHNSKSVKAIECIWSGDIKLPQLTYFPSETWEGWEGTYNSGDGYASQELLPDGQLLRMVRGDKLILGAFDGDYSITKYFFSDPSAGFLTLSGSNGIANLDQTLTINGQTVEPTFIYRGYDATASTWPAYVGETLNIAGSGDSPLLNQVAFGNGSYDEAVKFENGQYYGVSIPSYNLSTNDFAIHLIYTHKHGSGTDRVFGKTGAGAGWNFIVDGANQLKFAITDGVTPKNNFVSGLTVGAVYDVWIFGDKSGSMDAYVNNSISDSDDISTVGDLDNSDDFSIGTAAATGPCECGVIYLAMWQDAGMIGADNATVVSDAFYKWSGLYPSKATGTPEPNFYTRAYSAYMDKYDPDTGITSLINCGSGVPRVGRQKDKNDTVFEGMLIEPQATNLIASSNAFEVTPWSGVATTTPISTTVLSPDPALYMSEIIADGTTGVHARLASVTCTAAAHCFSVILKRGSLDWVRIRNSTAGTSVYFDLLNMAVGSSPSATDYGIKDLGGGYTLVWIVMTAIAGANGFYITLADDDNDQTVTGDSSTVQTYCAFAQVEVGTKPTSRIYTAGATATRLADSLQYNGDNVTAGQGAFVADVLIDDHTVTGYPRSIEISDGVGTNRLDFFINQTSGYPTARGFDGGVSQWDILGAIDLADGEIHKIRNIWETNSAKQFIDGSLDGTPDTSCTIPTGLTDIDIGQSHSDLAQLNGWIRNVQIWDHPEEDF